MTYISTAMFNFHLLFIGIGIAYDRLRGCGLISVVVFSLCPHRAPCRLVDSLPPWMRAEVDVAHAVLRRRSKPSSVAPTPRSFRFSRRRDHIRLADDEDAADEHGAFALGVESPSDDDEADAAAAKTAPSRPSVDDDGLASPFIVPSAGADSDADSDTAPLASSPVVPMTFKETVYLGLFFCFIWFFANYTSNAGLQYTSVSSSTILSSTSGFFTLLIGAAFGVEKLTPVKLVSVVAWCARRARTWR